MFNDLMRLQDNNNENDSPDVSRYRKLFTLIDEGMSNDELWEVIDSTLDAIDIENRERLDMRTYSLESSYLNFHNSKITEFKEACVLAARLAMFRKNRTTGSRGKLDYKIRSLIKGGMAKMNESLPGYMIAGNSSYETKPVQNVMNHLTMCDKVSFQTLTEADTYRGRLMDKHPDNKYMSQVCPKCGMYHVHRG